jgi:hypothetical protein
VFENLIGNDQIEGFRKNVAADVEVGEGNCLVRLELERPPVVPRCDFESVEINHAQLVEPRASFAVRNDPHPVGGVEADRAKNSPKPVTVDVLQHLRP